MKTVGTLFAVVALSGAPIAREPITFFGIGAIKVGARVSRIRETVGVEFKDAELSTSDESCQQYQIGNDDSLVIMAEDGIITRVETWDSRYRTASGAKVGDTEAQVQRIYGRRLAIEQHTYDETGHYLIVRSKDRKYALVMETDGKVVTGIRAGRSPSAEYVEGCL